MNVSGNWTEKNPEREWGEALPLTITDDMVHSDWKSVLPSIFCLTSLKCSGVQRTAAEPCTWPHSSWLETSVLLELEERRKGDGFICSWLPGLELQKSLYFCVKMSLQKSTSLNWLGMQSQASDNTDMNALSRTKGGFATLLLSRIFMLKSLRVFNFYKVIIFKVKKVQFLLLKTSCCKRNGISLQIT